MRRLGCVAAVLVAALALGGCRRADRRHAGPVRRIVSLAPAWTEAVFALGAGDRLVGVDEFSDYPPAAKRVPSVGSGLNPSLERLLALKPDLVLLWSGAFTPELIHDLGRFGVPVLAADTDSLDGIFADLDRLGALLGRDDAAHAAVARLRARLAAIEARVAPLPRVKMVLVEWTDPLTVIGSHTFLSDAIAAAGGANVAGDSPQPYPQYSVERLLARAPDVVVVGRQYNGPPLAPLYKLTSLPAVRDHRVYQIDGDILFRPGPRVVDGIEALSRMLHP